MRPGRILLFFVLSVALVATATPPVGASPSAQQPSSSDRLPDVADAWASLPAQRTRFERLSGEAGSYLFGVEQILQDHRGLMWFASIGGLAKYDGYQLTAYSPDPGDPDSLPYEFVTAMWEDSNGELWVGSGGDCRGWIKLRASSPTTTDTDRCIAYVRILPDCYGLAPGGACSLWTGQPARSSAPISTTRRHLMIPTVRRATTYGPFTKTEKGISGWPPGTA